MQKKCEIVPVEKFNSLRTAYKGGEPYVFGLDSSKKYYIKNGSYPIEYGEITILFDSIVLDKKHGSLHLKGKTFEDEGKKIPINLIQFEIGIVKNDTINFLKNIGESNNNGEFDLKFTFNKRENLYVKGAMYLIEEYKIGQLLK